MPHSPIRLSRRHAMVALAASLAGPHLSQTSAVAGDPVRRRGIKLGYDNFAVRAMGWNARQLIDHAQALECDSVFITDFGPLEGRFDDAFLGELRRYAVDRGVGIELGSWSICPTSKSFKPDWGSAEEHLALGIRMSRALGSRAFRVILGNQSDRLTPGGIAARSADTVAVLKACRSQAIDANVKIAVENHAGDLQSRELKELVEAAGPDFVGVNFDSGNTIWTLEDPVAALATLAPHVLTTSLRDTQVWTTDTGVAAQWTAMGEGCVDLPAFFDLFEKQCPGVTVHIETISGFTKDLPVWTTEFWQAFPEARAADFARFLELAKRGHRIEPFQAPAGVERKEADQAYQLAELSRSIAFCRDRLGLGLRG